MRNVGVAIALGVFASIVLAPAAGAEGDSETSAAVAARNASIAAMNQGIEAANQASWDQAVTHFEKAIALDEKNYAAYYGLGTVRHKQKRWDEAAAAYERALALSPDVAMYALRAGQARFEAGAIDAARPHLETAVRLEPELARAHHLLGRIHRDRGAPKQAAEALTRACQLAPTRSGEACTDLAALYLTWGHHDEAVQVAEAAVTVILDPELRARAYELLGRARDRQGEPRRAVEAYSQALDSKKDLTVAYLRRGLAYAALGDKTKARADLERYLTANAGTAFHREQAIAALRALAK